MTRNVAYLLKGEAWALASAAMVALVCSLAFIAVLGSGVFGLATAFADDEEEDKQLTAYQLQQEIEARQESYAEARNEAEQAAEAIDEKQKAIDELRRMIPAQQERSAQAARELYKFQSQGASLVDFLLSAATFDDFLKEIEYVSYITEANVNELNRLHKLEEDIVAAQDELVNAKSNADARAEDERLALLAAQEAQAEVQRRIEEEARAQAEIAIMAQKLAEQERLNDVVDNPANGGDGGEAQPNEGENPEAEPNAGGNPETENVVEEPSADEGESGGTQVATVSAADMPADEAAFVAEWAPRIDAYLAGSPLAGQGTTFARAAYAYGVDPRFSPAISFTESSKGAVCFLSHNAWGWGSASWDTWEEAINDHVAGLAAGYGGQISVEGARKYCPPNWQTWYDRTLGQMELI